MPLWDALSEQERASLRSAARPRIYSPRSPLMYQGDETDHVIIIETGWVKVTTVAADGTEVVLAVRGPGEIVGESVMLGQPLSATVTALGTVQALVIAVSPFSAFLEEHPGAWRALAHTVMHRLDDADRRLRAQASADGAQRLAQVLLYLAELSEHYEASSTQEREIPVPLSQEELASWADASRETVSKVLRNWRRAGLVSTGWRKLTVLDRRALADWADGKRPTGSERSFAEQPSDKPDQLTTAEWRVVRLAAEGHSNRQIAAKLNITLSTIETHLTRAYRKLNIHERGELPNAVRNASAAGQRPATVTSSPSATPASTGSTTDTVDTGP